MKQENHDRLIASYAAWKAWTPDAPTATRNAIFAAEIARAKIRPGSRILEIGFGEGTFLDWARDHGYACEGLEINDELVAAARRRGHKCYRGSTRDVLSMGAEPFDAIVLFDVLEHMEFDDIFTLFDDLHRLLGPDGKIIARFPNGASPFGRAFQHGDATHVTALTGSLVSQIGQATGFEMISERNAARDATRHGAGFRNSALVRRAAFLARDIIQFTLSMVYFGRNMPMDPNLTVVLRKRR